LSICSSAKASSLTLTTFDPLGSLASEMSCFVFELFHTLAPQTLQKLSKNQKNAFLTVGSRSPERAEFIKREEFLFAILEYSIDSLDHDLFARQLTCTLLLINGGLERTLVHQLKYIWSPSLSSASTI
jgi:hypothetical protein